MTRHLTEALVIELEDWVTIRLVQAQYLGTGSRGLMCCSDVPLCDPPSRMTSTCKALKKVSHSLSASKSWIHIDVAQSFRHLYGESEGVGRVVGL